MHAPTKVIFALLLSSIAASPSPANPVDIYTRYFAGVSGGKPCYARYYGLAHLNAHPKQTVRRIEVGFDQDRRDDKATKNTPADFGFMLKRSNEWYGQELFCKVAADHFECHLDADGGTFRLTPEDSGLRLEVTGGGGGAPIKLLRRAPTGANSARLAAMIAFSSYSEPTASSANRAEASSAECPLSRLLLSPQTGHSAASSPITHS